MKSESVLLIHPPVSKPCEPPSGLAKLAGALQYHGVSSRLIDANLEGLLHLLAGSCGLSDTWTRRAYAHRDESLAELRSMAGYKNIGRYTRVVMEMNRILHVASGPDGKRVGMGNYQDRELSPLRSADLITAAELPDQNPFFPYFKTRIVTVCEETPPSLVGISLNYLSQALNTFALVGFLKKICPQVRIVLGGGLITSWMRRPDWKNPFSGLIDETVAGPGEKSLLSLVGIHNNREDYIPSYEAFPLTDYLAPVPILPYSASIGCYWNRCSFCPERAEGTLYRAVSAERIISDLSFLHRRMKPGLIHFLDNALSPALLNVLSENHLEAPWYGFARVSDRLADRDFCRALKHSGCVMLKLGIESGDQDVLDALRKGITITAISAALQALKASGIATYVYLLFGTPAETETSARKTLAFTVRHSDLIDFLNLAIFNLPAFGPDTEKMETEDFYEGDLSLYRSFVHPEGWGRARVRQFLDREFKRHGAIQSILKNDPPIFTSNHAPFFVMQL
ncbi:MAG: radical SAM protein [Deltaproteobacteria bacterium]|nr:radical SAM protein [Deltaproteobacteria bacterium]